MDTQIVALVIEDDNEDYYVLERQFRKNPECRLVRTESLKEGRKRIEREEFDVILLDLTLPDSRGIATVKEFMDVDTVPIVVLSGIDNEQIALESVQLGAQDYLVKGSFDADLLFRTIRYAIERTKLKKELHASREEIRRERELRRLQSDVSPTPLPADHAMNEGKSLKYTHSSVFEWAVLQHASILDNALEQRAFKVEHNVSNSLKALASELGVYKATPRDVVEIHTATINLKLNRVRPEKNRVLNEEARYLLAGLLGHLCSLYRSDSLRFRAEPELLKSQVISDVKQ